MTAILRGTFQKEALLVLPERPRLKTELDMSKRVPTGPTIPVSVGADLGTLAYNNPSATLECQPGFYPKTVWRKPPGYGYNTIKVAGTPPDRMHTPADVAAGVQIVGDNGNPSWKTSGTVGEIPYKMNLIGVHAVTPDNSQPGFFYGAAEICGEPPTRIQDLPYDIILKYCVIQVPDTSWRRFSLLSNGISIGAEKSWFAGAHYLNWPAGVDSNGLSHFAGQGPYTFKDCLIWGSEESLSTGNTGNGNFAYARLRQADFSYTRCHIYHPVSWKHQNQLKNSTEMKQGSRVEFINCVSENTWRDVQQPGWGFFFWSSQEEPYGGTHDIYIENHWFINCSGILGLDPHYQQRNNPPFKRIHLKNAVATGFADPTICSSPYDSTIHNRAFEFASEFSAGRNQVEVCSEITLDNVHVHLGPTGLWNEMFRIHPHVHRNLRIRSGIYGVDAGQGFFKTSEGDGNAGWAIVAPDGSGGEFKNNLVCDPNGGSTRVTAGPGVSGNNYVGDRSQLGLVDPNAIHNTSIQLADLTKMALAPTSPYKGTGLGGADPGPDIPALITALSGVRVGFP